MKDAWHSQCHFSKSPLLVSFRNHLYRPIIVYWTVYVRHRIRIFFVCLSLSLFLSGHWLTSKLLLISLYDTWHLLDSHFGFPALEASCYTFTDWHREDGRGLGYLIKKDTMLTTKYPYDAFEAVNICRMKFGVTHSYWKLHFHPSQLTNKITEISEFQSD